MGLNGPILPILHKNTEENKMKNDTTRKDASAELDFNDLEMVSGGGFIDSVKKVSEYFWDEIVDFFS